MSNENLKLKNVGVDAHIDPQNKGITLIALIITIIVMLILVAVSVTVALEGGLFGTAKDAAIKTQAEADKEMLLSYVMGAVGEKAEVDFEKLDKSIESSEFEGSNGRYTKGDKTYLVDLNGTIKESALPKGYRECEYLQSTRVQWIDTGVQSASDLKICIDVTVSGDGTNFDDEVIIGRKNYCRSKYDMY